jgi:UDP-N-acetylenolpyruvoylglucosamine reductase
VNEDHATAEDFLALVNEIKRLVEEQYHISLHMSIKPKIILL